jgi:hypothetical protein
VNKLDIISRFSLVKTVTTTTSKLAIIKDLIDIRESYYLGIMENYKNVDLPDFYPSDVNLIKPFVGFIQVAIDDEETGVTEELHERGFLLTVKVIKGEIYVGFVGKLDIPKFTIDMVSKWDFDSNKLVRVRGFYPHEPTHDETLEQVVNMLTPAVSGIIKEIIHFKMEVFEYEPTTFSFKKKVAPKDRPLYREYRLIKPAKLEEAKAKIEDQQFNKGFVRDTILKNIFPQEDRFNNLLQQLKDSVWFSGLPELIEHGMEVSKPNMTNLPFENFTVVANTRHRSGYVAAMMVNVIRTKSGIAAFVYLQSDKASRRKFDLCYHFKINSDWVVQSSSIFPLPKTSNGVSENEYKTGLRSVEVYIQDLTILLLSKFLEVVFNYETEKVSGSFRKNKVKDRADKDPDFIPKNVHLVLDMSKRRQYPITKGNRISGYHMPEHKRIGYTRTSKNGVVHFVKGSIVNEGKGDLYGRVSKEYKL